MMMLVCILTLKIVFNLQCSMFNLLELWTSSYKCLTSLVALVLLEILDEASSQILSLLVPLSSISVSVTRIEDVGRSEERRVGKECL